MVDLEFLVHFLQLRDGVALDADLGRAIEELVAEELLSPDLLAAHDFMTRMLVAGRLLCPDQSEPPPAAAAALARSCQCETYDALLRSLREARGQVAQAWDAAFDMDLEIE